MTTLLEAVTALSDALRDHPPMVDCPCVDSDSLCDNCRTFEASYGTGGYSCEDSDCSVCKGKTEVPDKRFLPLRDAMLGVLHFYPYGGSLIARLGPYADGAVLGAIEDALRAGKITLYWVYTGAVSLCEGLTRLVKGEGEA
jgi:hypothetical protein